MVRIPWESAQDEYPSFDNVQTRLFTILLNGKYGKMQNNNDRERDFFIMYVCRMALFKLRLNLVQNTDVGIETNYFLNIESEAYRKTIHM